MIQRVQTLYLLVIAALMACTVFLPLATFVGDGAEYTLTAFGLADADGAVVQSTLYLGIMLAVTAFVPFVMIFMFKHRMAQIRFCVVEVILLLGSIAMMVIYLYLCHRAFAVFEFNMVSIKIPTVFPLVSIVFDILALRGIYRDEMLVRSLRRIR